HLHEDHIGGLDDVINNFNIISLYLPNDTSTTKTYEDVLMAIYEKDLTIKHSKKGIVIFNDTINGKLLKAEMLSPIQNSYSNANDYSPVIKLTYDEATFLFTGDAEKLVEDELLDDDVDLRADVLKVGHHGSSSSSSAAFVQAVSPKISIISVGKDNKYGHPSDAVIKRLISNGSLVYRTDKDGTIVVKSNGNIYDVLTNDNTLTYHNNYGETLVVNDEKRKYLGWIYVG
ncbi:MAG TPA: MBL fold metallo-hydrolase, partial [Haloplasmataceae bacterium]